MRKTLILAGILLCLTATAQQRTKAVKHRRALRVEAAPEPPRIFTFVDQEATFPGNVSEYIRQQLRYPEAALEDGAEGGAEVLFEIRKDGTVRFLSLRRSTGYGPMDAEARRIISSMPAWRPGKRQGLPVRTLMVLPVVFRLN